MSTRRVDSSTSGPLMRIPSCAPRPVPTIRAVGVASPRAHGQAMISTATRGGERHGRAVGGRGGEPEPERGHREGDHDRDEHGRPPGRRAAGPAPCRSGRPATSRAIWARAVSAPTRVASTTSRPPALTVAPVTGVAGTDLDGHGLTGEQRRVDGRGAVDDGPVGGHLLARAHDEAVADGELVDRDAGLDAVAEHGDVLGTELEQRLQGGAGAALGPGLEVAPGEDEHGDAGRHLEVDLRAPVAALRGPREPVGHADLAGRPEEQGVERPAEGGQHAHRDEGVHGGRGVAQVEPGGPVEGPCAPRHDRRGQGQRQPLPGVELQRGDHRQEDHRDGQDEGDEEPGAQGRGLVGSTLEAGAAAPADAEVGGSGSRAV